MSKSVYDMVAEFHKAFGMPISKSPTMVSIDREDLRISLIEEEWAEVCNAIFRQDIENLAKELSDLIYVTVGMAIEYGIPLEKCIEEVHRSNMSKLGEDGKPRYREDGKVLKGPNYILADIGKVLYANNSV